MPFHQSGQVDAVTLNYSSSAMAPLSPSIPRRFSSTASSSSGSTPKYTSYRSNATSSILDRPTFRSSARADCNKSSYNLTRFTGPSHTERYTSSSSLGSSSRSTTSGSSPSGLSSSFDLSKYSPHNYVPNIQRTSPGGSGLGGSGLGGSGLGSSGAASSASSDRSSSVTDLLGGDELSSERRWSTLKVPTRRFGEEVTGDRRNNNTGSRSAAALPDNNNACNQPRDNPDCPRGDSDGDADSDSDGDAHTNGDRQDGGGGDDGGAQRDARDGPRDVAQSSLPTRSGPVVELLAGNNNEGPGCSSASAASSFAAAVRPCLRQLARAPQPSPRATSTRSMSRPPPDDGATLAAYLLAESFSVSASRTSEADPPPSLALAHLASFILWFVWTVATTSFLYAFILGVVTPLAYPTAARRAPRHHATFQLAPLAKSFKECSTSGRPNQGRSRVQGVRDERCGLNGLRNIGNTCFMNSVIQCLSNTRPLLEYLLNEQYMADINTTTSSMKGALIKAFSQVIQELWENEGDHVVNTSSLKSQIQRFAPRFMGYSQQDAQEFLRYLLEGLHEDVNRVTVKPKPINTDIPDSYSDSLKATESWKRYLRNEDSTIVDVFVGQLRSSLRCTVCDHVSLTLDPFWDLSLPIPSRNGTVKLNQCLEHFTKEEVLDGDEKPTCSKCQTRRKCTKSFSIQKFPKILVIHLKRFSPMERFRGKLNVLVDFPLTGLDLSAFAAPRVPGCTYNLYGVANHSGTTHSGHYTAYCKHPYSGEWHEYNDSSVTPVSTRSVVSSEGYVLFYEQQAHSSHL